MFNSESVGLQAGNNVGGANLPDTYGWGFEAKGEVQPSNFNYPRSDVRLDRDAAAKLFGKTPTTLNGPVANPANLPGAFSASIPPGNDQSLITFRDDDPGTIYDLDSPGFLMQVRGQGEILRFRMNFKEYALLTSDGVRYRTSAIKEGHVAFSIQQKTAPQGTDWQPLPFASVDAVAGDYSAGQGHINLSWDLK